VQNADDAGAETVKFFLGGLEGFESGEGSACGYLHQGFGDFAGLSLYAWNDASFTEPDFKAIRNIGASSKKSDATKTGKFGLGFNAVYHFTDLPSFVTGKFLVIMDPHQRMLLGADGEKAFARRWNFLDPKQSSCKGHAKWFNVKGHPCNFSEEYPGHSPNCPALFL
jgi:sacsin